MKTYLSAVLLASGALAGCADMPNAYGPNASYSSAATRLAVLESVQARPMKRPPPSAVQTVIGSGLAGAVGGVACSAFGGGKGKQVLTTVCATGGAAAGNVAMDRSATVEGLELTYTLLSCTGVNCTFTVVQEDDKTPFRPGQRVRISRGNGGDRVIAL